MDQNNSTSPIHKLSEDQNTLEVDGMTFTAGKEPRDLCFGCAFYYGGELQSYCLHKLSDEQLACTPKSRKDGTNIIWIRQE